MFKVGDRVFLKEDTIQGRFKAGEKGTVLLTRSTRREDLGHLIDIAFDREPDEPSMQAWENELELDIICKSPLWEALK